jgi:predicted transglutaminase-like cysteine proteinase
MFHLRSRSSLRTRDCTLSIGRVVAATAVVAMPSQLMAQPAGHSADISEFRGCDGQSSDLPIQMASAPLNEVEPSAGPRLESKAAAILGGQMSKLERMRVVQASGNLHTAEVSSSIIQSSPSAFREECEDTADLQIRPISEQQTSIPANAILGSLSITVRQTPLDRKWSAVNAKQGQGRMTAFLSATRARHSSGEVAQVEAINSWVNRKIEFGEDRDIYGRADYWAPAAETLRRGIGDCEDFAIAKMELLAALGVTRDKMRLVIARDLVRNADHAVLVVTLSGGAVMLDNMTDRLLDARLPNDYRPIMSFSQNAKWVHGYAAQPARQVRMAAATSAVLPAAPRLADVLTVTAEPEMPALSMALLSVPLVLPSGLLARA